MHPLMFTVGEITGPCVRPRLAMIHRSLRTRCRNVGFTLARHSPARLVRAIRSSLLRVAICLSRCRCVPLFLRWLTRSTLLCALQIRSLFSSLVPLSSPAWTAVV